MITQLYKHSTTSGGSSGVVYERKTENVAPRPIALPLIAEDDFNYVEPANSFFKQKHNVLMTKVDWHNWTHIDMEKNRRGPGERGKAFKLTKPEDIRRNEELNRVNGYFAVASDIISVNRSVADIRHPL